MAVKKQVKNKVQVPEVEFPYLTSIDIGFGESKYISSCWGEMRIIPSMVMRGSKYENDAYGPQEITESQLVVTTEDGTFSVGEYTRDVSNNTKKRTIERDRANDLISRVLFQTVIALSVPHEDGEYDVIVPTGLPTGDMDKTIKTNLEKFLKQSFEVEFHIGKDKSIKKKINVKRVFINHQPAGTVAHNQFDYDLYGTDLLKVTERFKSYVGVIDIGRYTGDFIICKNGRPLTSHPGTYGSTIAVDAVCNILANKLPIFFDKEGFSQYEVKEEHIDAALLDKKIVFAGHEFDVTEIVREAVDIVAKEIVENVLRAWGSEANYLEEIILTGGGSELFKEAIKAEFDAKGVQQFNISSAPQFANVLGYYLLATVQLYNDTYTQEEVMQKYVKEVFNFEEVASAEEESNG